MSGESQSSGDQDATMTDIGEKVRPPGEPPDMSASWVKKVTGSMSGGRPVPELLLNDEFVSERVTLEFPNGEDGEPVITIGSEVLDVMNGMWKQCMIVKVLGRNVPLAALSRRLREMWKPQGAMYVMDLPRQFFMIRFELEEEYLTALTGGPWRAFGSYLMVQAWSPGFDPLRDEIATTPVWIRLSNIPVNFYHKSILLGIARGLGKPVRVDLTTLNFERARFARVCVEVDLKKPLKGSVMINGERYYVSYEGLTNICSLCGIYGHLVHTCPRREIERAVEVPSSEVALVADEPKQVGDGFTVVRRTGRRAEPPEKRINSAAKNQAQNLGRNLKDISGNKNIQSNSGNKNTQNIVTSNRFGSLEEDMVSQDSREVAVIEEANKENIFNGGKVGNTKSGDQVRPKSVGLGEKGKEGPQEKRTWIPKPTNNVGPKLKNKPNRPTRGLVFGLSKGEQELSKSGKRLRMESGSVGRPGGIFVKAGEGVARGETSNTINEKELMTTVSKPAEETGNREIVMYGESQSGGLWLLWRTGVGEVSIVESTDQFIHAKVVNGLEIIHIIVVYAAPSVSRRSGLWGQLSQVIGGISDPLIIGGDFNTILRLDERTGGNGRLSLDSLAFGDWINESMLIDMGFRGNKFTWRRGKAQNTFIAKRLDRVLCCAQTRLRWQEAVVQHLPFLASDHAPLYIQLSPEVRGNPKRRPFRFEAAWLKHQGFNELLLNSWRSELTTQEALRGLQVKLQKWNKEVFGDVHRKKESLANQIKEVQDLLDLNQSDQLLQTEESLLKEFEAVLEQEEMIWFQKSREKLIALGDRNTSFFHTSTIIRRRRNRIEMLKNDEGNWISDAQELENHAIDYYKRLYSLENVDEATVSLLPTGFARLTGSELTELDKSVTATEIEESMRCMSRFKAPGPDGYQPVFYQTCWEVVGPSVVRFVLNFFESGILPAETNDALLVLIAKVAQPEKITQFRPISLCNVLFKIITKTMVLRLKKVMPKLIGPAQASFIPGRLSTDNIVLVQEAVHSMRRKKDRKGWMLLKLDLEKAYDRIRWDFLEDTLKTVGLSEKWRRWIMQCVSGPSMAVLWNGEKTAPFTPSRGLRQGDPLSPYLFVLCLERLCHLIELAVDSKEWKPINLSRGGPKLSHVCFADDLILFAEASVSQVRVIRKVLEKFCLASGQKMDSKGIKPNGFTIVSLLSACAKLGALILGKRVHVYMIKVGLTRNLHSNNVLLDFYVRCGRVEEAKTLFDEMLDKNSVSCTSLIVGLAVNGFGKEVIELFRNMESKEGVLPCEITFMGFYMHVATAGW
ncbi:Pentatricopeptide repeat [Arabidopsis thaliana x Arabidopsis arenosa]|uniref:Pentatricopeptide repeat n=1 Tax=Arabidopsis thaliana x Arabidopsis arenosa TaxID=1240361 RepID=A0A8T2BQ12_9BRAS|nr:Pentatricopeptide repeat [Arabidopsis thaliana x Arabidopsis arenosa]